MKSILDPSFRYTPSSETDIRKTFNRVRRELARSPSKAAPRGRVVPFDRAKATAVN